MILDTICPLSGLRKTFNRSGHGFLPGLLQHLGGGPTGISIKSDVTQVMISVILLTFDFNWGTAGPVSFSSSQCNMLMTHMFLNSFDRV